MLSGFFYCQKRNRGGVGLEVKLGLDIVSLDTSTGSGAVGSL